MYELKGIQEDKPKEACGIFGVFSNEDIYLGNIMYYGLSALQHRGQESAGIAISDGEQINCYKGMGLVSQVFDVEKLQELKGKIAIAHNGNITNAEGLKEKLKAKGAVFKTTSDSEVILKLLEMEPHVEIKDKFINGLKYLKGSYSLILSTKDTLIAVRDSLGIRPLCIGKLNGNYVISSESCALSSLKIEFIRDVNPGEMIIISNKSMESVNVFKKKIMDFVHLNIYILLEETVL
ncbi:MULTISPECIES: amidophosphoribosyltransferase [Clostridium]|uniref:Amidophosphoribosyltransferase n=1 Tax=Clostridium ragsdalei P11 TaxID=1353534 RepID=A0A1A6AWB8_9CLOT|nr:MULTISPECIES: hypothetical protein [Clostridium]OBR94342.1 amidophosphoribosyltransferase precursor [Clostridium ragsdalei P11]